ncbi:transporter [Flavobacterium silvaticum]|uniref:Transporter n=1 Tax=Flavobacterium silvaticum TaxID=1852020 RepID=A0A972FQT7_9FLAO|nr:transporter [Flavobacterium silvaticum]NMH26783.1 transporter [Flavobacterium silvaticum]
MSYIGKKIPAILLLAASPVFAQFTDVINSNRPGESMSAFSVGKTVIQAELGVTYNSMNHDVLKYDIDGLDTELVLRYGALLEQLEFIGELTYSNEQVDNATGDFNRRGFRQGYIGAKYLVYDPHKKHFDDKPDLRSWKANHRFRWRDVIPAVGVYVGANIKMSDKFPPLTQDQKVSGKAMIITQNQLGRYVFVTNFYMDRFGSNFETMGYVLTLTYGVNDRWSAFIENQAIQSDFYGDLIFRGGAAYLLAENMQIDASIGAGVKSTPSVLNAGIGFSWRFDANYEDVIIRLPGEEKADGKKDKKKKKKRKDEVTPEEPAKP